MSMERGSLNTDDGLRRAPEVAQRLGISKQRVYDLVRRGLLPVVRIGRHMRFDGAAIEAWIEAGGAALPERRE